MYMHIESHRTQNILPDYIQRYKQNKNHGSKTGDVQMLTLPEDIGNLNAITTLDISQNRLSELPASIGGCVSLVHLRAFQNRLTEIPAGVGSMPGLRELLLSNNALTYVHPAVRVLCVHLMTDLTD
jgi:Leucine-rich repeat (LRR) protein